MSTSKPISTVLTVTSGAIATTGTQVFFNTGTPSQPSSVVVGVSGGGGTSFSPNTSFVQAGSLTTGSLTISNGFNTVVETISRSPHNYTEPTVGSTSVSVYQVAALLENGNSVSAVHREFPSLSRQNINAARDYAKQFPNPAAVATYPTDTLKDFVLNTGFDKLK